MKRPANGALLSRLLHAATLLAALTCAPPAAAFERLDDVVRPLGQRLALELDPRRDDYRGSTAIALEVVRETPAIRLHAREPKIERAVLDCDGAPKRTLRSSALADERIELADGAPISPGRCRLELDFVVPFNRNAVALYKTEIRGAPYLFTQFEAIDARGAFPCFDEPAFKIPFDLELTIPAGFDAIANTGLESEAPTAQGGRTIRFRTTHPLPSYLVAFAVGTFDFVPIPGMSTPGRIVAPKGMGELAAAAVETTPPLLAALERWFGASYPYDKLDLLAIPEYWFGAMENPGAITYAAEVLLPGAHPSAGNKRRLASITAHELAHMWFGDYVTLAWWDDFWLNESFADWMGDKAAEEVYPEMGIAASEVGSIDSRMTSDARPSARPVRIAGSPEEMMQGAGIAYEKGKAVLGMVEGWIGAERFRAGVLDYLARHAWGNASGADLWGALERASGEPVESVLRPFLDQPGLPLVTVEPLGGTRLRLTQRRYATAGVTLPPLSWRIPLRIEAGDGKRTIETKLVLDSTPVEIELAGLDRLEWILPNAGPSGYYRWSIPRDAFERLAGAAAPPNAAPSPLTPHERQHLLGNASALLASGDLAADGFLSLLTQLGRDADPGVVGSVLQALERMRQPFGFDGRAPGWAAYVDAVVRPALDRFGREPRPGESPEIAALRPRLLLQLGRDAGDAETLGWARSETAKLLAGTSSLDDALAGVATSLAAWRGDAALYEQFLARALAENATPTEHGRYLSALTSFPDRELAERTLALYPEGKLRGDELFFFRGLEDIDETMPDRLLEWKIANYAKIAADLPPEFLPFLVRTDGGCDRARVERAAEFFGAPERKAPGTDRQIAQTRDQLAACLELRQREGKTAERYLAGVAK